MGVKLTRREILCVGSAVAVAGCVSDEQETREPERVLYIAAGNEHILDGSGVYDAVEIEVGGGLRFEPGGYLQLEDLKR